ncbi:hypothetical protein BDV19DRAFT_392963 [Aspergillus venezuelensis]
MSPSTPMLWGVEAAKAQSVQRVSSVYWDSTMPPFPPDGNFLKLHSTYPEDIRKDLQMDGEVGPGRKISPFDVEKPTCSINLLCHRNGELQKHQIHVIHHRRCKGLEEFLKLIDDNNELISSDKQLLTTMRHIYEQEMYGVWRRIFSFKFLRRIRLVAFTPYDYHPVPAFLPEYVEQNILFAYRYPQKQDLGDQWIEWVYKLRQPTRRFALEFVEAWSALKILIAASAVLAISTSIGIVLAVSLNDAQTAFTIASYVLCGGSFFLAVLAIVSSVETSSSNGDSQTQLLLHNMSINHVSPAKDIPADNLKRDEQSKPREIKPTDLNKQDQSLPAPALLLEQLQNRNDIEAKTKEQERDTLKESEQRPKSALF